MPSSRRSRAVVSIALSLLFLAGLPSLALADPGVAPHTSNPEISGIVKDSGTNPIAGIAVSIWAVSGPEFASGTTDASGAYSFMVDVASYTVRFEDHNFKYLHGSYKDTAPGKFVVDYPSATSVDVVGHVALPDVTLPVGIHITGRLTGPAVPPNPLAGVDVMANGGSPSYTEHTTTATDGTYSLTVPGGLSISYTMAFGFKQALYEDPCVAYAVVHRNMYGCSQVLVGDTDATGVNAQMGLLAGDTLTLSPAETTVAAGTSQAFTAMLGGAPRQGVLPAGSIAPVDADVSAVTAFTIAFASGSAVPCIGATCTPTVAGDYTVTAKYGITASAILHVTAPAATPAPTADPPAAPTAAPTVAPTAGVTTPPTSTNSSGGDPGSGAGGSFTMLLTNLAGAALLSLALRRRLVPCRSDFE